MPPDLARAYSEALAQLPALVAAAAGRDWDDDFVVCALAAIAASKGAHALAETVLELSPDVLGEFRPWLEER